MFARSLIIMLRYPVGSDMDTGLATVNTYPMFVGGRFRVHESFPAGKMRVSPGLRASKVRLYRISVICYPVTRRTAEICHHIVCFRCGQARVRLSLPHI